MESREVNYWELAKGICLIINSLGISIATLLIVVLPFAAAYLHINYAADYSLIAGLLPLLGVFLDRLFGKMVEIKRIEKNDAVGTTDKPDR